MQHILDMPRRLIIVSVRDLLMYLFMDSSILTTMYVFSFFLIFKLCKSGLQMIYLISDCHIFLGSVHIKSDLVVEYKVNFNSWSFFRCFCFTCKLVKSGLYMILYFGHGQCFIWAFSTGIHKKDSFNNFFLAIFFLDIYFSTSFFLITTFF